VARIVRATVLTSGVIIVTSAPLTRDPEPLALDQAAAAKLTGLSAKTLARLADAGEPVGRVKIGRRVIYHRASLAAWLAARTTGRASAQSPITRIEPTAHS
jgi:hypothetical protein